MKVFVFALFVAAAVAVPIPDEESGDPVEVIVNGLADGEPLEISDIVDIKLKEKVAGEVASVTNLLHPFSAQGLAEAAAVEAENVNLDVNVVDAPVYTDNKPEVLPGLYLPEPVGVEPVIVVPEAIMPEIAPEPVIVVPEATMPEIAPEPVIVVPEATMPEIVPEPVIIVPEATMPEIIPEPVQVVEAAQIPNGEIFNDGLVQVSVNTPQDTGVLATLQSWFSLVMNYFNDGVQTTQQIV